MLSLAITPLTHSPNRMGALVDSDQSAVRVCRVNVLLYAQFLLVKNLYVMFRALAVIASLVGVSAFSPAGRVSRSSALKMDFSQELGAQPPLGFWDPLGILNDADQERFEK